MKNTNSFALNAEKTIIASLVPLRLRWTFVIPLFNRDLRNNIIESLPEEVFGKLDNLEKM